MFGLNSMSIINKEYKDCIQDQDLAQIGCNIGLRDDNIYKWRATMLGPQESPYADGLYYIDIDFPNNYPQSGPEFKFENPIYHLNVDFKKDKGHICLSNINEWQMTGKVTGRQVYNVKQALFDIFCLFYNQGVEGAYDEDMAQEYRNNRPTFDSKVKEWVEKYAKP